MAALDGVLVVALEQAVAAPFATRQLADLGARVIKVERPDGGDFARDYDHAVCGQSSYFVWLNRGKESIQLDLKDQADRGVLDRLIARADVFVQNLAPGAAVRLGLATSDLRATHDQLIICSISGYGATGPYSDRKAYDLLLQCETGLVSITGSPDGCAKVGISVADIAAGMYAYSGILAALLNRERTGRGTVLDVAMIDALGEWMSQPVYYGAATGSEPARSGARHASIAPYGPYPCANDEQVFVAVQNDREWKRLCTDLLDMPELVADARFIHNPERVENNEALTNILANCFARYSSVELSAALDGVGIANAQLRSVSEFHTHPQLAARDRWRNVMTPGGLMRALLPPLSIDEDEPPMLSVPDLGQHNDSVRAEFAVP